jgi:F0F1-type ATP synthase membrane subunit c/vacuolar-type H+-ATPase subunit K
MGLFRHSRGDLPLEERRRGFVRVAGFVAALLAVGFALCAAQVWRALHSGRVWADYHGAIVTQSEMRNQFVFFVVGAVLSSVAWFWLRSRRRRL